MPPPEYAGHNHTMRAATPATIDVCINRHRRALELRSDGAPTGPASDNRRPGQLMWPWEHLAIGYLAYSVLVRSTERRAPAAGGAIAVAFGTQFPDLVDKTLGWMTTILPSGQSLGHSALFAIPTIVAVVIVAMLVGRAYLGAAFGVGYLSHLPGDVVYPALLGGELELAFLLWPIVESPASQPTAVFAYVQELLAKFGAALSTPQGIYYLLFEMSLLTVALLLWVYDGTPGLPWRTRGSPGEVP